MKKVLVMSSGNDLSSAVKKEEGKINLDKQLVGLPPEIIKEQKARIGLGIKPSFAIVGADGLNAGLIKSIAELMAEKSDICPIVVGCATDIKEVNPNEMNFPKREPMTLTLTNPHENMGALRTINDVGESPTLERLKRMNLSEDQVKEILYSPSARMEDETQDQYKIRRKTKQLIEKHRHNL